MKKTILTMIAVLGIALGGIARAEEGGYAWDKSPNRTNDLQSLQNGAKLFVNYCIGCHSAAFMRYNRLGDIGLSEAQIKANLLFATDKVGETMKSAIDPKQAKEWFGANPPDLTVISRSRSGHGGTGPDYLYTFLRTFYRDDARPTGWNNLAFPNVGMPNPLWQLQGQRRPIMEEREEHGEKIHVVSGWEQLTPGTMTPLQYEQAVGDLVNYLQWMGEPAANTRVRVGVWVLIFLGIFSFFAWRLSASYWRAVR
ncbi:cytochrome c1 [Xylophilus sp. Kf1]|nr:cytochrome c1 [Xylophilus sp. Kf1]